MPKYTTGEWRLGRLAAKWINVPGRVLGEASNEIHVCALRWEELGGQVYTME